MKRIALSLAAIAALGGTVRSAQASTVSLGQAANFTVLALNNVKFDFTNPGSTIIGNVGLGPHAVQNWSDGVIQGTYYVDPTANNTHQNNVQISGGTVVTSLAQAVADADAAAALASSLAPQQTFGNITNAMTINGNGGDNIIRINSINFTGAGDVLTIHGGVNETFVIDVTNSIVLTQGASGIVLSGGVMERNVLFNIESTGDALKTSGNPFIHGVYLAANGKVGLDPGTGFGEIIAGGDLAITSSADMTGTPTPVPLPPAVWMGLATLGGIAVRKLRRRAV